jgi:hypothetical protein
MAENISRRNPCFAPIVGDFSKMGAGTLAATCFFTNNTGIPLIVRTITERHGTAEVTAGSLTATVLKVPSGTAVASGTALHATGINLKGTANTNASPTLGDVSALTLADGDSLGVNPSAAGTEIANVAITVLMEPLNG